MKITALHLDRVDVQVGNVDVARAQPLRRQFARIGAAAGMGNLVASAVPRGERPEWLERPDAAETTEQTMLDDDPDEPAPEQ